MKTFFLGKEDEDIERFLERLRREEDGAVLVIPKGAHVRGNHAFFHRLKEYAMTAGKDLLIESIDEGALKSARSAGLEAVHPLFGAEKKVSDVGAAHRVGAGERREGKRKTHRQEGDSLPQRKEKNNADEDVEKFRVSIPWRTLLILSTIVVAGVVVYALVFGKADIRIRFHKAPFAYSETFLIDASLGAINSEKRVLPGQIFTSEKNLTQLFPASGSKQVSEKATGVVTIYNTFSSDPQILVASTRLKTPDGKIFRLTQQVRVPGAEIQDGNVTASKIQTVVIADAPGEDYNVGPVSKLTLPGFKDTARYDKFYGVLENGATGGFKGTKSVPTSRDIEEGKEQLATILRNVLGNEFLLGYPPDVIVIPGASELVVTRLSAGETTDEQGNFSVFGEAQVKAVGFREADLSNMFVEIAAHDEDSGLVLQPLQIAYSEAKPDFEARTLSFVASATGTLTTGFDMTIFKRTIEGKTPIHAHEFLSKLPGFESATISLRPFWLRSIPKKESRIQVVIE